MTPRSARSSSEQVVEGSGSLRLGFVFGHFASVCGSCSVALISTRRSTSWSLFDVWRLAVDLADSALWLWRCGIIGIVACGPLGCVPENCGVLFYARLVAIRKCTVQCLGFTSSNIRCSINVMPEASILVACCLRHIDWLRFPHDRQAGYLISPFHS